ncbi:MAG TPA: GNAT family N-acetyltransferase [Pyrinomonadaceae bacterium]|jgi:GNAT superfamily N-acetyltransferase|nr:GNAT family N-acetyltransferase [Pyrinomonadaceae bacterium]
MHLCFRQATLEDLPDIVRMLADDFLGQRRERNEDPLPETYIKAFREIDADPNNELIVAIMSAPPAVAGGSPPQMSNQLPRTKNPKIELVVGTLQLTYTPSISFQGGSRCTVESVRVDEKYRGHGIGREMMLWAIERAKEKGCISMQLTTDAERADAHRFYENLGFTASHIGMKLKLK